jgi:hypothetical protein
VSHKQKERQGSPHRVSLKYTPLPPLSLRTVYNYVTQCIFLVSLNILCTYRAVYITSSRPRSLEWVICEFAADFSLTFSRVFSPAVNWIALRVHCYLTKLALYYRK